MPDNKIRLRIITPSRELYDEKVDMVIMRTVEGDVGILSGHAPLTVLLDLGVFKIINDKEEKKAAVFAGFAEITPNMITVLSDGAQWPEEIDSERAQRARERAVERLNAKDVHLDIKRAENALRRAVIRLELAGSMSRSSL